MKHPGFLFLVVLLASASALAQPSTFLRMFGNGNSGYAVREVNGNDYVVAGGTDFYYNYHWHLMSPVNSTNIHLLQTNASGMPAWEKIYSMPGYRTLARWLEPAQDGGFILCGSRNQDKTWPPDSNDIVLLKTNASGVLQWAKVFDTGKDELGFCVQPTFDGGYIVAAFHDSMPVSLAFSTFLVLLKTDAAGVLQWEKKYPVPVRDLVTGEAFPCALRQVADSGYVVTGTTVGSHPADIFVLRTDVSGNLLWTKSYEHAPSMFRFSTGADIAESTTGELIVAGSMDKDRDLFQFNNPFVMRLTSSGIILDAGIYDTNPSPFFQSGFSSVEETPDGGFFFTGMGGYAGFGDQAQFLRANAELVMQWSRVYTWDGLATMGARSARHTSDGGYVFTGKRQMDGTVLMKTDGSGLIPCKNPGTLSKILPSLVIQSRSPAISSGIMTMAALFNEQSPFTDTASLCPEQSFTLPVKYLILVAEAVKDAVEVNWTTATEVNNDFFVVERSRSGAEFELAGKVDGAGNSSVPLNYSFRDENSFGTPVSYYRLKQVDYDGSVNFSDVVSVERQQAEFRFISVTTDRLNHSIGIRFFATSAGNMEYYLYDRMGREIARRTIACVEGLQQFDMETGVLTPGVYGLTFGNGKEIYRAKIFY